MPSGEQVLGDLRDQRVVVTGGSGFIGGHVVAALCRAGANVLSVDRRPAKEFRCHPAGDHGVTVVLGDLKDGAVIEASVETGTKAIVHLAAQTQVLRSIEDPQGTFDNNVVVTGALAGAGSPGWCYQFCARLIERRWSARERRDLTRGGARSPR